MKTYHVQIKFRNNSYLDFNLDSDEDIKANIENACNGLGRNVILLADYVIPPSEILWIKVGDESIGKSGGSELPNIREEK